MYITNELLASVFADSAAFCGREEVLHAIIFHRLKEAGFSHTRIAREQRLAEGRVDIVVYDEACDGNFTSTTRKPLAAIEVKGGAYGNRNALRDEIDAWGYCGDMAKLKSVAIAGVESWFICVDMQELRWAVSRLKPKLVAERCAEYGLAFAYYCQGEDSFLVSRPKQNLLTHPLDKPASRSCEGGLDFLWDRADTRFQAFAEDCLAVVGHEANITARLYDCLRDVSYGASQLSLETYFNFAARGSRMQDRPDLVVFKAGFDGRFNLYQDGDRTRSNDQHKLAHINAIFEVKGGASMANKSDRAVKGAYLVDISKLSQWRADALKKRKGTQVHTVFLGVDSRPSRLSAGAMETLVVECKNRGHGFIYISRHGVEAIPA